MKEKDREAFQELHQNAQEFCRSSGPLNKNYKSGFPLSLTNGLELAAAALGGLVLAAALLAFSVTSSPLAILEDEPSSSEAHGESTVTTTSETSPTRST